MKIQNGNRRCAARSGWQASDVLLKFDKLPTVRLFQLTKRGDKGAADLKK